MYIVANGVLDYVASYCVQCRAVKCSEVFLDLLLGLIWHVPNYHYYGREFSRGPIFIKTLVLW